jgi:multisubunit Na+/H+ antiporter MnhF subunit
MDITLAFEFGLIIGVIAALSTVALLKYITGPRD